MKPVCSGGFLQSVRRDKNITCKHGRKQSKKRIETEKYWSTYLPLNSALLAKSSNTKNLDVFDMKVHVVNFFGTRRKPKNLFLLKVGFKHLTIQLLRTEHLNTLIKESGMLLNKL